MLRIAICDDMHDQLEMVAAYINEYLNAKGIDAEVRLFAHPDALLDACETEQFHIYIMDIVMPMINGIQLGTEIRRMDREARIIYITTAPEYALNSFAANPINYLLKPLNKQQLFDTVTLALRHIDTASDSSMAVRTREGLRVLPLMSIVCCQRSGYSVLFTMSDGETVHSLSIRSSFSEYAEPLLKDRRFLQPHASYILNMNRVERMTGRDFIMKGGLVIPISKNQVARARELYCDYLFQKGGGQG